MINVAILDDEEMELEAAKTIVEGWSMQNSTRIQLATFVFEDDLLQFAAAKNPKPDIAIIDIQMSGIGGMETARRLKMLIPDCIVIFLTNYWENVFDGYKVDAFRYVLKKNAKEGLEEAMKSAALRLTDMDMYFICSVHKKQVRILCRDIICFESSLRVVQIRMIGQEENITFYGKLTEIEKKLNPREFTRCHQSYLVNLKYVMGLNEGQIVLRNNLGTIPYSEKYKDELERMILWSVR